MVLCYRSPGDGQQLTRHLKLSRQRADRQPAALIWPGIAENAITENMSMNTENRTEPSRQLSSSERANFRIKSLTFVA
jgi:hypothetical protein